MDVEGAADRIPESSARDVEGVGAKSVGFTQIIWLHRPSIAAERAGSHDGLLVDPPLPSTVEMHEDEAHRGILSVDLGARLAASRAVSVIGFASTAADGKENRVQASLQYANGTHATYYHAFDRPTPLASTVLHTIFERGAAHSTGWIPTRLQMQGQAAPEALLQFSRLLDRPLTIREAFPTLGVQALRSWRGLRYRPAFEHPGEERGASS